MEYRVGEMVFNDWEIVREIGSGASGQVWEIVKRIMIFPYLPH